MEPWDVPRKPQAWSEHGTACEKTAGRTSLGLCLPVSTRSTPRNLSLNIDTRQTSANAARSALFSNCCVAPPARSLEGIPTCRARPACLARLPAASGSLLPHCLTVRQDTVLTYLNCKDGRWRCHFPLTLPLCSCRSRALAQYPFSILSSALKSRDVDSEEGIPRQGRHKHKPLDERQAGTGSAGLK